MLNLKKIQIKNYRSFVDEEILFDNITAIVGPNEGGKTNILKAISHLDQENSFQHDDLRKGSKDYPDGKIEIQYEIILNDKIIPELLSEVPNLNNKTFIITKKGKTSEDASYEYKLLDLQNIDKIILIKKVGNFKKSFDKAELRAFDKALQNKWLIKSPTLNLTKTPFPQLRKKKDISVLDNNKSLNKFLSEKIFEELQSNIKIYFWEYNKDAFLKNIVSINELITTPGKFIAVKNIFKIAGWNTSPSGLRKKLVDLDASDVAVLLKNVENEINKLISKTWRQHKELNISIQHRKEDLLIHLQEINTLTKPELRSDGLKWFLSFLINFRARSETMSDYIILIDEPALHLHPRGQKDVLSEIKGLARNNQVIYTTHQTFMIDKNHPDRIRILKRQSIKSDGQDYYFASKVTNKINTKDITTDPLLRESLGFKISDISPINDKNLLVEGRFDRNLIYLLNQYFPSIDLDEYSIISCSGASDIKKFGNFLIGNELDIYCLYDSDTLGMSNYNDTSENYLPKTIKTHIKLLDDSFSDLETPEDLFGVSVLKSSIAKVKEIKDIEISNKQPFMKQLNIFFQKNNIEKEARYIIKHNLEDILLESLKDELEQKNIPIGDDLIKYLKAIASKLDKKS